MSIFGQELTADVAAPVAVLRSPDRIRGRSSLPHSACRAAEAATSSDGTPMATSDQKPRWSLPLFRVARQS